MTALNELQRIERAREKQRELEEEIRRRRERFLNMVLGKLRRNLREPKKE